MSDPIAERWLPVVGYEGLYEVSDRGQVRSIDRVTPYRGGTRRSRGRVIAPRTVRGRSIVDLHRDAARETRTVGTLVLEAFVGPRPQGQYGCHADDDPANNRLGNLRWGTPTSNNFDSVRNGTHFNAGKTRCPRNHLLTDPNLLLRPPNGPGRPRRSCLACHRARGTVRKSGLDHGTVADRHYANLMKE